MNENGHKPVPPPTRQSPPGPASENHILNAVHKAEEVKTEHPKNTAPAVRPIIPVLEPEADLRLPPQQVEAELSCLGAMMLGDYAIEESAAILTAADFYRPGHRYLFTAMVEMHQRREPVDLITLPAELNRRGWIEEAGGLPYIAGLLHIVPSAAIVLHYANLVLRSSKLRQLIAWCEQTAEEAYKARVLDADGVIDRAEAGILALGQKGVSKQDWIKLAQALHEQNVEMDKQRDAGEILSGISTGFESIDAILGGFKPGQLVVIGGRPSHGKSSVALSMAINNARGGARVGFFSLEMSKGELVQRVFGTVAGVDSHRAQNPQILVNSEWDAIQDLCEDTREMPLYIDDRNDLAVGDIRKGARRLKAGLNGLDVVYVDYLQIMRVARREELRTQEIQIIVQGLKNLARELNCTVVVLSQLTRAAAQREGKRPELADLRDSGSIEAEADIVILVNRPSLYYRPSDKLDPNQEEAAEVIIAKHRNGPIGTAIMGFVPRFARFQDLQDQSLRQEQT